MLDQILTINIFAFMLIFSRVGTMFFLFPGFRGKQVNIRTRLSIALALAFILTPLLADELPGLPKTTMMLFALIMGEVLAGAIIATVALILFSAVQTTGTVIAFISAMANSLVFDPISEQQSAIVAGFLTTTATLLIFVTGLHHVFIRAMIDSYALFQPGVTPEISDAMALITRTVSETFKIGVQLAAPFIVVSIVYNLVLGVMTRLSPQIPIFFVAMPAQIVVSMVLLMITVPAIMMAFMNYVQDGLLPFVSAP